MCGGASVTKQLHIGHYAIALTRTRAAAVSAEALNVNSSQALAALFSFNVGNQRVALVLSAGGMFGAWQAGAWRALSARLHPDLVVGASVGALNGYVIAGGGAPEDLSELWRRPEQADWDRLPETIRALTERFRLGMDYAVVLTDLLRLKPKIFSGRDITWRHVAASCAVPLMGRQQHIGGRWYSDGGLLNPLPVWAAVELGAMPSELGANRYGPNPLRAPLSV